MFRQYITDNEQITNREKMYRNSLATILKHVWKVKLENVLTKKIQLTNGFKQICTESPLIFNIYLNYTGENVKKTIREGISIYIIYAKQRVVDRCYDYLH